MVNTLSRDDLITASSTFTAQINILERILNDPNLYVTDDLLRAIFNIKEKEDVNV